MKDPNPTIPLEAKLLGLNLIVKGLRKLPIEEALDLVNELAGQANAFIKKIEDEEKAAEEASTKAVETVAKTLKKHRGRAPGSKNKPKEDTKNPAVDAGTPVL